MGDGPVSPQLDLMTVREVADAMRVSTMTVYRLINAGELPALRVGRHFRVLRSDLEAYVQHRRVQGRKGESWPAA